MIVNVDPVAGEQQLHSLYQQQRQLQEQLAAVSTDIARVSSSSSHDAAAKLSSAQKAYKPLEQTVSQGNMVRNNSSRGHRHSISSPMTLPQNASLMRRMATTGGRPFQKLQHNTTPVTPWTVDSPQVDSLDRWVTNSHEDPYSSFAQYTSMQRSNSRKEYSRNYDVEASPMFRLEDPATYIARSAPNFCGSTFPYTILPPHINDMSLSLFQNNQLGSLNLSPAPTTTTRTTFDNHMSRQNSTRTEAARGVSMLRIDSNLPMNSQGQIDDLDLFIETSQMCKEFPTIENPTTTERVTTLSTQMTRSISTESSSSTSSTRSQKQLQRINKLSTRRLRPKEDLKVLKAPLINKSVSSTPSVAISKTSVYVRPRRDPLKCDKCNDKPEGYRGPHELNRHVARIHNTSVKRWICVEPTKDLPADAPLPVKPLSKCKTCLEQKSYGIDYNAAAHLRRSHFTPKARSRGRAPRMNVAEKKSAKSGGDWPPMSMLRFWLEEVFDSSADGGDDDDREPEEEPFERGECGSLGFDDVGNPAAEMLSSGSYDPFSNSSTFGVGMQDYSSTTDPVWIPRVHNSRPQKHNMLHEDDFASFLEAGHSFELSLGCQSYHGTSAILSPFNADFNKGTTLNGTHPAVDDALFCNDLSFECNF